jgi:hypothetical protein
MILITQRLLAREPVIGANLTTLDAPDGFLLNRAARGNPASARAEFSRC